MTGHLNWLRPLIALVVLAFLLVAVIHTPQYQRLFYPYRYRQLIETNAAEFGVDPLLVAAVMRTESNFTETAVSHKGALGLMQIMPDTAHWIASKLGMPALTTAEIIDPAVNIRLGTWYLAYLNREFAGRTDIAVAAYNAGPGQVNSWLQSETWSGRYAERESIPFAETRHFLFKVRTAHVKYQELYR